MPSTSADPRHLPNELLSRSALPAGPDLTAQTASCNSRRENRWATSQDLVSGGDRFPAAARQAKGCDASFSAASSSALSSTSVAASRSGNCSVVRALASGAVIPGRLRSHASAVVVSEMPRAEATRAHLHAEHAGAPARARAARLRGRVPRPRRRPVARPRQLPDHDLWPAGFRGHLGFFVFMATTWAST